jgi:hypothetical protein
MHLIPSSFITLELSSYWIGRSATPPLSFNLCLDVYIKVGCLVTQTIPPFPLFYPFNLHPHYSTFIMIDIRLVILGFVAIVCIVSITLLDLYLMHLPPPPNPASDIELQCLQVMLTQG